MGSNEMSFPEEIAFGQELELTIGESSQKWVVVEVGQNGQFCGSKVIELASGQSLALGGTFSDLSIRNEIGTSWTIDRVVDGFTKLFGQMPQDCEFVLNLYEQSKIPPRPLFLGESNRI